MAYPSNDVTCRLRLRIGVMRAINRHRPKEFNTSRKTTRWGKRKLKRDE
jgi:hypothetical protein